MAVRNGANVVSLNIVKTWNLENKKFYRDTCILCRKPVSRFEVMQLQKTMGEMLEKSGVNDSDTEIKGPTQVRKN